MEFSSSTNTATLISNSRTTLLWFTGIVLLFFSSFSSHGTLPFFPSVSAFNIDVKQPVIYNGNRSTLFGFTVLQHMDRGSKFLMVGAPETQRRGGLVSGAVYRLSPVDSSIMQEIPFETRAIETEVQSEVTKTIGDIPRLSRDGQWLGATLVSSGRDGVVAACAPRYTFISPNHDRKEPVGICFLATDSFSRVEEYSPCRDGPWGYHRQGSCQAGMSAAVTEDMEDFILGSPGSWYWQGQDFVFDRTRGIGSSDDPQYKTLESPPLEDDTYLGYSTAVGRFDGGQKQTIAAGRPRGNMLRGEVVFYDTQLVPLPFANLTSDQVGSYFGYSLAVGDFNGDGLDDLAVGAPMYAIYKDRAPEQVELGRVFVFLQNGGGSRGGRGGGGFGDAITLTGILPRGRFGLSVANMGDINLDRYDDLAVGAPYGGPGGKGAIHVFLGGPNGIDDEISQTIEAAGIDRRLSGFGFSIAGGGYDMDNNSYPDVFVGAYDSDQAVLLKSRPVVTMDARLTAGSGVIDPDVKACPPENPRFPCDTLNLRFNYAGENVPDDLLITVDTRADTNKTTLGTERVTLTDASGKRLPERFTIPLRRGRATEETYYVVARDAKYIRDQLTPIVVEFSYQVQPESVGRLQPAIGPKSINTIRQTLNFKKDCGYDEECIPNLSVTATPSEREYMLGDPAPLTFDVTINNSGDDAFESMLYIDVPRGVQYRSYQPRDIITCSLIHHTGNGEDYSDDDDDNDRRRVSTKQLDNGNNGDAGGGQIRCELGHPFHRGEQVKLRFEFEPSYVNGEVDFKFNVTSLNADMRDTQGDNVYMVTVRVIAEAILELDAFALPEQLFYELQSSKKPEEYTHEEDVGPRVTFVFNVKNAGKTRMKRGSIRIVWPERSAQGMPLLYRTAEPIIIGNAVCNEPRGPDQRFRTNIENLILNDTSYNQYFADGESYNARRNQQGGVSASGGGDQIGDILLTQERNRGTSSGGVARTFGAVPESRRGRTTTTTTTARSFNNNGDERRNRGNGRERSRSSSSQSNGRRRDEEFVTINQFGDNRQRQQPGSRTVQRELILGDVGGRRNRPTQDVYSETVESTEWSRVRSKRQASTVDRAQLLADQSEWENPRRDCGATDCEILQCTMFDVGSFDSVTIYVFARLWSETMRYLKVQEDRTITAKVMAKVDELSNGFEPLENSFAKRHVTVTVLPSDMNLLAGGGIPWWIILLAILLGLLLLILLLLCLWKCGFFKRKRVPRNTATAVVSGPVPVETATVAPVVAAPASVNGSNAQYQQYRYDGADNRYYPGNATRTGR